MRVKNWTAAALNETIYRTHPRVCTFLGFILDHQSIHQTSSPKSHPMSHTPVHVTYVGSWVQLVEEVLGLDLNHLWHLPLRSRLTVFSVQLRQKWLIQAGGWRWAKKGQGKLRPVPITVGMLRPGTTRRWRQSQSFILSCLWSSTYVNGKQLNFV